MFLFYPCLPVHYWYILALEMSELVVGICGEKETWCMVLSEELIFALIAFFKNLRSPKLISSVNE